MEKPVYTVRIITQMHPSFDMKMTVIPRVGDRIVIENHKLTKLRVKSAVLGPSSKDVDAIVHTDIIC